jgi:hypothetical protein
MGHVKISHAAALNSVGWYLMMPPTQEQLDSTCRGGPSVMDHVAALIGRDDADKVHTRRCDQEGVSLFWTSFSCCNSALFICIGALVARYRAANGGWSLIQHFSINHRQRWQVIGCKLVVCGMCGSEKAA